MRRLPAAVAALAAALALAGCGIQETDVIEAGGPATVQVVPHSPTGMVLFFRSPDGEPMPVVRYLEGEFADNRNPGTSTPETVAALFDGPIGNERKAGLTTGLPLLPLGRQVRVESGAEGGVVVRLPIALDSLDDTAVRQLICTIAFTEDAEGRSGVVLRGTDVTLGHANCDVDIDLGRLPRPTSVPR
ncbi:hypothetical protein [Streptomyces sp. NPDC002889]|uniref:hypothetical protein n=1 Tax=Streptomyces sp. NPDC002889 TaxID=3364669 RepID=UPI0036B502A8